MEDNIFKVMDIREPIDHERLMSVLESILFAAGDAVKRKDLMRIMNIDENALNAVVLLYAEELEKRESGLKLLQLENRLQLGTKEENTIYLKELLGVNERQSLSKGALECLSIIAFKQPVTRVDIDEIRGVNSDYVLTKLQEKALIKEVGRKDAPGRPKLYGTTDDFLIQFGFTSIQEMREENEIPEKIMERDKLKKELEMDEIELFEDEE